MALSKTVKFILNQFKFLTSSGTYRGPGLGDLIASASDTDPISVKNGAADPSVGAGVAGNPGDMYRRDAAGPDGGELWVKDGDANTAWSKVQTVGPVHVSVNPQTSSYQLQLTDDAGLIDMDVATPNTLTVPPSGTVPFPVGTQVAVRQVGVGQTTIAGGMGVTIQSKDGLKVSGRYGLVALVKVASDTWALTGTLSL